MRIECRVLVPGQASGAIAAIAPLSFWGGYDPVSGLVSDRSHPAFGQSLAAKILVMSTGRGSSSSSSVLAEAIRLGTGPAAIVLAEPDTILATGAVVAETLYGLTCPVLVLPPDSHRALAAAAAAAIVSAGDRGTVECD